MLFPEHISTITGKNNQLIKYSSKINKICCENRAYFLFSYKNQTILSDIQIKKSFDVCVTVKYSYRFPGALLVELQWHINQNNIAIDFLKILLAEKVCFSDFTLTSFKYALFGIFKTRVELKAWSPYKS